MKKIQFVFFGLAVAAVAGLLTFSLFFSKTGLVRHNRLKTEHSKLLDSTRALRQENTDLSAEVEALQNNDAYIEKVARDRMGMVKGDEIILKVR
ncbi:MAG: septum formation initiator family protein [Deltaproteobacteria bacterium]|nr:septum formation initiator family protein [Deltaproteobacteria bacterium]